MKFRQRRGQAFETMMLVISVIVALAILGVLLGILNSLPGIGGADAQQAFKEELKKISGAYSPGTPPRDATLKGGTVVNARLVTTDTTMLEETVQFVVDSQLQGSAIELLDNGKGIRATKDSKVTFTVCGDPAPASGPAIYVISIAPEKRGTAAIDACLQKLGG
ncbi:MAG: hypothetical protein Q8R15_05290 [Candidatus Micrarchaeota archaeon]|nr:hypothetical protein [Candidatus Micrarchaeota archaeon]